MLNQNDSEKQFQGKVRVRVCGILKENSEILLLKHNSIGPEGYLWSPPGGGVEFGENIAETLKKEFLEETNLHVEVGEYLFANEYIGGNHHAIELFFEVRRLSGDLELGSDPELSAEKQILTEARFFSASDLAAIPENAIHNAFNAAGERDKITELRGLITFKH